MTPFTNQQVIVLLILMVFAAAVGAASAWGFLRTRKPVEPPKPEEKKPAAPRVPAIEVSPNLTTGKVTVTLRVTGEDGMANPNAYGLTGLWRPTHARDIAALLVKAADIVDPPKPEVP